jgi:hypothetical protein
MSGLKRSSPIVIDEDAGHIHQPTVEDIECEWFYGKSKKVRKLAVKSIPPVRPTEITIGEFVEKNWVVIGEVFEYLWSQREKLSWWLQAWAAWWEALSTDEEPVIDDKRALVYVRNKMLERAWEAMLEAHLDGFDRFIVEGPEWASFEMGFKVERCLWYLDTRGDGEVIAPYRVTGKRIKYQRVVSASDDELGGRVVDVLKMVKHRVKDGKIRIEYKVEKQKQ